MATMLVQCPILVFAFPCLNGSYLKSFLSQYCGDLVRLNAMHRDNLAGHIGIEVTTVGPHFVSGTMPVDERTTQPFGLLHGGASMVLAETLGSVASYLLVSATSGARFQGSFSD